jgi:signal transduction histidine kinase
VLIVWRLYEHRQRRRSEAAANELSGRLISAQEEERARLARELHDDVTQRLGVLALEAGREERNLPNSAGGAAMRSMPEGWRASAGTFTPCRIACILPFSKISAYARR